MSTTPNALADFRLFSGVTESWELMKTGLIILAGKMYRLELWHSYSNADIPYYVAIYVDDNGVWRHMPDPPFPIAPDPDEALRTAMAFLSERAA